MTFSEKQIQNRIEGAVETVCKSALSPVRATRVRNLRAYATELHKIVAQDILEGYCTRNEMTMILVLAALRCHTNNEGETEK